MPGLAQRDADLELLRVSIREEGAFGVLLAQAPAASWVAQDGQPIAVTLERTYPQPDAPKGQLLKIPVGRHRCVRSFYFRGKYPSIEILVAGHSRLLFHRGNLEEDSEGCVLVGRGFELLHGKPGVAESAQGFAALMAWAGDRAGFDLLVRNA